MREPLAGAFASPDAKHRYTRRLFHTIAGRYDLITRLLSFGCDQGWKRRLLALGGIGPSSRVLDLACGTGDLALQCGVAGAPVVGLDFTAAMIDLARRKPGAERIAWIVGDMVALPVRAASVDVITTGYGLRNVPDLSGALAEMHRVLRPDGRVCSLDFDRPEGAALRGLFLGYLTVVGAIAGAVLHGDPDTYRYVPASISRYPGARAVAVLMERAGFRDVRHVPVFGGLMAIHIATK